MKNLSYAEFQRRLARAKRRKRGMRVSVSVAFTPEDLVLIANRGIPITPAGLRAFVREFAVERELRWMRAAVVGWSYEDPASASSERSRRAGANERAADSPVSRVSAAPLRQHGAVRGVERP